MNLNCTQYNPSVTTDYAPHDTSTTKGFRVVKALLTLLLAMHFCDDAIAQSTASGKIDWGIWATRPLGSTYTKGELGPRVYMDPGPHMYALLEEDAQREDDLEPLSEDSETEQPCFIDIRQVKGAIQLAFLGHSEKGDSAASAIRVLSFDKSSSSGELKFLRTGHTYEFDLVYTLGSGLVDIMLTDNRYSWHFHDARYDGAGIRKDR